MTFISNGATLADAAGNLPDFHHAHAHGGNGSANMRIEFANAERPGIDWTRPVFRIGSATDNDLVLEGAGIAPHHLQLQRDARGLSLTVAPGAGRVYLNARQVRERALVRAGDSLGIGDTRLRLSDVMRTEAPRIGQAGLRAVAGPLSGRARQIGEHLDLDNAGPWPLGFAHAPDACISLSRKDDALHVRCMHLPEGLRLALNGVPVRDAVLRDGDQIAIGPHRFIVDACERAAETPPPAVDADAWPEDSAGPRREVWWLIVTAAALALLIAVFLLVRL